MSKERKMILDMIENGKITADEALMLFEALDNEPEAASGVQPGESPRIKSEYLPHTPLRQVPSLNIHRKLRQPDPGYAAALNAIGFNPSSRRMVNLMEAEIPIEDIQGLLNVRRKEWTDDEIADFLIQGIDEHFILGLHELGLGSSSPHQIIELAIHDVTPAYIRDIREAIQQEIDISTLIEFGIHDVSPGFAREIYSINISNLEPRHLVELKIHDVDLQALRAASEYFEEISAREAVEMGIHNITPEFVEEARRSGISDITMKDLIEMRIHNVDFGMVREANKLDRISPRKVIELAVHGATAEYVREIIESGLPGLTHTNLVEMLVQDVKPGYVNQMLALDLPDISANKITEMKIHSLHPEDARRGKEFIGETCTAEKLVEMKIQGTL